ncbi:MAG: radical SAM protein [Verrucomicrobiota bacterium]
MRVLFIKSSRLEVAVNTYEPPMGLLSLAAYLRKKMGAEVRVANVVQMQDPAREVADVVRDMEPDLVGLSGLTCEAFMLHQSAQIAKTIRPGVPVIAGGPYPSSDPERLLADRNIDAAVIGEGEETLLDLALRIQGEGRQFVNPGNLAAIRGVAYRGEDGVVRLSPPRPPIEDLDSLPQPAWDTIDLRWFWARRSMSGGGVRPYLPVFTSRGCPYGCTYCHNLFGRGFRFRSAECVVEEIVALRRTHGVNDFEFLDDCVNLDPRRFEAILQGLLDRGLHPKLHFPNGIRTDLLDEAQIRLLHQVGTGEVSVAVETTSSRLQKLIHKHLNLEKVRSNIELMADLRIFTRGFFMLGFPTETKEELRATIDFAVSSRLHMAGFWILNPYPGTPIYEQFKALGRLPNDVNSIDYDYGRAPFNGSEVPDKTFYGLHREAYRRFYFRPGRIMRILRDRPYSSGYGSLVRNFFSVQRLSHRQREEAGAPDIANGGLPAQRARITAER